MDEMMSHVTPWVRVTMANALVTGTSLPGLRVTRKLMAIMARRGKSKTIVSDNGTELTSMTVLRWCQDIRIDWHYFTPPLPGSACTAYATGSKPMQNALIESFNGSFRDEPLNETLFATPAEALARITA